MNGILLKKSDIAPARLGGYDSMATRRENEAKFDMDLLARCERSYNNKDSFRKERSRTLQYLFGNQWGDYVTYNGVDMTEEDFIRMKNNVPLKNNVMFSLYNSVTGLHAKQETEPVCFARSHRYGNLADMMSSTLQTNWQNTSMPDLCDSLFGEYLCSGAAFSRETYEVRTDGIADAWTDYCNPYYMFWECGSDPRNTDFRMIGMLHDISREELYAKFARKETGLDIRELDETYSPFTSNAENAGFLGVNEVNDYSNLSFSVPSSPELCRVIEVWTQEVKERWQCRDMMAQEQGSAYFRMEKDDKAGLKSLLDENNKRKELYESAGVPEEERIYITAELVPDIYWQYTFLAPNGRILCSGESEYDFKSHPFTASFWPYVNGEVHSFLGVVIDQQRYINRLITMNDMAVRSAVKGVKFLPLSLKPDEMSTEEYVSQFTEYDSTFVYDDRKTRTGAKPEFFAQSAFNLGTSELLQTQLNLIHEIATVNGALQGKEPSSGTSAARYAQETQNASTSLYPLVKRFGIFKERMAMKKCQMIQQFYEDGRDVTRRDNDAVVYYDRSAARDIPFRISIKESASTPAYDMVLNDFLQGLFDRGAIPVEMYIKNSNMPFKDKLLQELAGYKEQMQAGIVPAQAPQVPGANQELAQMGTSAVKNIVNG